MSGQRGVALVTVLLICALAVAVCAALVSGQYRWIIGSGQQSQHRQAWQQALGGELLGLHALSQRPRDAAAMARAQRAAQPLPPRAIDAGLLQVTVHDAQARFNLNSVLRNGEPDPVALARLQALLTGLALDPRLAAAFVAWRRGQDEAMALPPLLDASELAALPGIDAAALAVLLPHVVALPADAGLNLNTASAPVLAALSPALSATDGQRLVQLRGAGYRSVSEFLQQPMLSQVAIASDGLVVEGRYFLIHSDVVVDDSRIRLASLVGGATGPPRVLSRQLLPPPPLETP